MKNYFYKVLLACFLTGPLHAQQVAEKPAGEACECPPPTKDGIAGVCIHMLQRYESDNPESKLGLSYQIRFLKLACADPVKDSKDVIRAKLQTMWNKYRESFRCINFPNSVATDLNITKFAVDIGMDVFIHEAVRRYKLDMNFLDPADKKTVLDFVIEQEALTLKSFPVDTSRLEDMRRVRKMLEEHGVKRAKDL